MCRLEGRLAREQRDTDQRHDDDLEADLDELFHDALPRDSSESFGKRCTSLPIGVRQALQGSRLNKREAEGGVVEAKYSSFSWYCGLVRGLDEPV